MSTGAHIPEREGGGTEAGKDKGGITWELTREGGINTEGVRQVTVSCFKCYKAHISKCIYFNKFKILAEITEQCCPITCGICKPK